MSESYKQFTSKNRKFELFEAQDGFIEIYDYDSPQQGFYFKDFKSLVHFVNSLTDVIEQKQVEDEANG